MATKHINYLNGKTGRIYTARKGTIMVFVLSDGAAFFASCVNPTSAIAETVPQFWMHSIDWAASDYEYIVFGMTKDSEDKPIYPVAKKLF